MERVPAHLGSSEDREKGDLLMTDPVHVRAIRCGGQTGADRAAVDFAIAWNIPYGGWVPLGGWAEDAPLPPGVLQQYPNFTGSGIWAVV